MCCLGKHLTVLALFCHGHIEIPCILLSVGSMCASPLLGCSNVSECSLDLAVISSKDLRSNTCLLLLTIAVDGRRVPM